MKKFTFIEQFVAKFLQNVLGYEGALHFLVCLWITTYGLIYGFAGGLIGAGVAVVLSLIKEFLIDEKPDYTDLFWGLWGIIVAFALYVPYDWLVA